MAVEVHDGPDYGLVDLEYVLEIVTGPPTESTVRGKTHFATRQEAEAERNRLFDAGYIGEVRLLCRRVSRWEQVPI